MSVQQNAAPKCAEDNEKRIVALRHRTDERHLSTSWADAARITADT